MKLTNICPICAAVVIAWLTGLVLMWLGFGVDKILVGILIGMSVGALATKYDWGRAWKAGMVILGGSAAWSLLNNKLVYAVILLVTLALLAALFKFKLNPKKGAQQSDRFKDCC